MSSKESDEDADDPVVSTMPMVINHKMGKKLYYMKDSIIPKYRKPYVTRSARIRPKHHILEFTKSNRERDAPKDPKDKRAYHEMKYQTTEMSRKNTNLAIGYTTGGVFYVSPVAHILRLSPKLEEDTTSKNVMVKVPDSPYQEWMFRCDPVRQSKKNAMALNKYWNNKKMYVEAVLRRKNDPKPITLNKKGAFPPMKPRKVYTLKADRRTSDGRVLYSACEQSSNKKQ